MKQTLLLILASLLLFPLGCQKKTETTNKEQSTTNNSSSTSNSRKGSANKTEENENATQNGERHASLDGNWVLMLPAPDFSEEVALVIYHLEKDSKGKYLVQELERNTTEGLPILELEEGKVDEGVVRLTLETQGFTLTFEGAQAGSVILGAIQPDGQPIWQPARMVQTDHESFDDDMTEMKKLDAEEDYAKILQAKSQIEGLRTFLNEKQGSYTSWQVLLRLLSESSLKDWNDEQISELASVSQHHAESWRPQLKNYMQLTLAEKFLSRRVGLNETRSLLDELKGNVADELQPAVESLSNRLLIVESTEKLKNGTPEEQQQALDTLQNHMAESGFDSQIAHTLASIADEKKNSDEAIEWYALLSVMPNAERSLLMEWRRSNEEHTLPSVRLSELWKEKHGNLEGLDEYKSNAYRNEIYKFAEPRDEESATPKDQRITLVELFTGGSCPPCVGADIALGGIEQTYDHSQLIALRYHQHIPANDPMTVLSGEERFHFYEGRGTPHLCVNGQVPGSFGGYLEHAEAYYDRLRGIIDPLIKDSSGIEIKLKASVENDEIKIEADVQGLKKLGPSHRLHLVIAEEEISYAARNGVFLHEMVVREMIEGADGIEPKDDKLSYTGSFSPAKLKEDISSSLERYQFPEIPLELKHLRLVGFVQDVDSKIIFQAVSIPLPDIPMKSEKDPPEKTESPEKSPTDSKKDSDSKKSEKTTPEETKSETPEKKAEEKGDSNSDEKKGGNKTENETEKKPQSTDETKDEPKDEPKDETSFWFGQPVNDGSGWFQVVSPFEPAWGMNQTFSENVIDENSVSNLEYVLFQDVPASSSKTGEANKQASQKRSSWEGRWFLAMDAPDGTTPMQLLEFTQKDKTFKIESLDFHPGFGELSVTKQEIEDSHINLEFKFQGNPLIFKGTVQEGVVRGCLILPGRFPIASLLLKTEEESLRDNFQKLVVRTPPDVLEAFEDALDSKEPLQAMTQFLKDHSTRALCLIAANRVCFQVLEERVPTREEIISLFQQSLKTAANWGPDVGTAQHLVLTQILAKTGIHSDLAENLLTAWKKKLTEKQRNDWLPIQAELEQDLKITKAMKQLQSGTAEEQKAAFALLSTFSKLGNIDASYSVASYFDKAGRIPDALNEFAKLIVQPGGERTWHNSPRVAFRNAPSPSESVQKLWKKDTGSLEGLEDWLDSEYLKLLEQFTEKKVQARPKDGPSRIALLELFTGSSCPPCVGADIAVGVVESTYPASDVITIRYHQHIPAPDPLASPENEERFEYYQGRGTPTVCFNGRQIPGVGGGFENARESYQMIQSRIEIARKQDSTIKIQMRATQKDDVVDISASAIGLKETSKETRLRLVLVEKGVSYKSRNGIRYHPMLARAFPAGIEGVGAKDGKFEVQKALSLKKLRTELLNHLKEVEEETRVQFRAKPVDFSNLHLVGFIQDDESGEILQTSLIPVESRKE